MSQKLLFLRNYIIFHRHSLLCRNIFHFPTFILHINHKKFHWDWKCIHFVVKHIPILHFPIKLLISCIIRFPSFFKIKLKSSILSTEVFIHITIFSFSTKKFITIFHILHKLSMRLFSAKIPIFYGICLFSTKVI